MVDRDVRRPRRIVRHAAPPNLGKPVKPAKAAASGVLVDLVDQANPGAASQPTVPIPAPGSAPSNETVPLALKAPAQPAETVPVPTADAEPPTGAATPPTHRPPPTSSPANPEPPGVTAEDDGTEPDGEIAGDGDKPPLGAMVLPERPDGFPTAATLADQDAAAAELRQELDLLRRQLDERPPPLPPARRRSRKPLLGVLVVGGTIGVLATAVLVPWSNLDLPGHDGGNQTVTAQPGSAQPGHAQPGKAQPGTALPGRAVPGVGTATPLALAPNPAPAGSLPVTGPGITTPGTMMVVQIGPAGDLDVVEHALLGPRGLRQINLTLPSMASLGGEVATLNPTVRNLRVSINGTPVTATPNADGNGWTVQAADQRARMVQLSYRITQAVVISKPSDAGRALAVSLPLLGQALRDQGLPLVVKVLGPQVGGVSCPGAPTAQMLCGMPTAGGWIATVPASASSPLLLLQLNLKN